MAANPSDFDVVSQAPQSSGPANPSDFDVVQPPRSALGEIGSQAKAGLYSGAGIGGAALQYVGAKDTGRAVRDWAERGEAANAAQPEQHGMVTNYLGKAAHFAGEVAPVLAAAPLLPEAGIGGAVLGAGAIAAPYALGAGQTTKEAYLEKNPGDEEGAAHAGAAAALTQGAAMTVAPGIAGKLVGGLAGKALGKAAAAPGVEGAIGDAVAKPTIGRAFAQKAAGDVAGNVAMGEASAAGQADVNKRYGISDQGAWDAAKEAFLPSVGAALAFGPLSYLHASKAVKDGSVRVQQVKDTLANGDAHPQARSRAAGAVYDAMAKSDPDGANMWRINAGEAIKQGKPIGLDNAWTQGLHPEVYPESREPAPDETMDNESGGQQQGTQPPDLSNPLEAAVEPPKALPAPGPIIDDGGNKLPTEQSTAADEAAATLDTHRAAYEAEQARLRASYPMGAAAAEANDSGAAAHKAGEVADQQQAETDNANQEAAAQRAKAAASDDTPTGINIRSILNNRAPMTLEQAQEAAKTIKGAKREYAVVEHPSGDGYGVVPKDLLDDSHPAVQKEQAFTGREQPAGDEHAVQEPEAGSVLQREQGQAGVAGGERGRVESGQQGDEAASQGAQAGANGQEVRPEVVPHEPGVEDHHQQALAKEPSEAEAQWGMRKPKSSVERQGVSAALSHLEDSDGEMHPLAKGLSGLHVFEKNEKSGNMDAGYSPSTGSIAVRGAEARAAAAGGWQGTQAVKRLAMAVMHEIGHYADATGLTGSKKFQSAQHPAFEIGGKHGAGGRVALGGIMKEVRNAYLNKPVASRMLAYPMDRWTDAPKTLTDSGTEAAAHEMFKSEVFAQLVKMHRFEPEAMREEMPKAFALMERINNESRTSGARGGVQQALRALSGDGDLGPGREGEGVRAGAGSPENGQAGAGLGAGAEDNGAGHVRAADVSSEAGKHTVNIGLNTNDGKGITKEEVRAALERAGVKVTKESIVQSDTEPTFVGSLDRPLTPDEAHRVSAELKQEAIAQKSDGVGELYGPGADKWKPFSNDYFHGHPDEMSAHEPRKYMRDESAIKIREEGVPKGLPKSPSIADIGNALNKLAPKRSYDNPKDIKSAAKQMFAELKYQLSQAKTGLGWYTGDVQKAWRYAAMVHPELATDPVKRQLISIVTGVHSPSVLARKNFTYGLRQYEHYKTAGEFSPVIDPTTGTRWSGKPAHEGAVAHINAMLADHARWGGADKAEEGVVNWLLTEHPKRMLEEERSRYGVWATGKEDAKGFVKPPNIKVGEAKELHLGTEMFGPKVGPFIGNLNGMETGITVDVWATRTLRRLFGTLPTEMKEGKIDGESPTNQERAIVSMMLRDAARNPELRSLGLKDGPDAQGVAWFFEQQLYDKMTGATESGFFSDGAKDYANAHGHDVDEQSAGHTTLTEARIPERRSEAAANADVQHPEQEHAERQPGSDDGLVGHEPRAATIPSNEAPKGKDYGLYQDILKKPGAVKEGMLESLHKLLAPASHGPFAKLTAGIFRANLARQDLEARVAEFNMRKYAAVFHKMTQEAQVKFVNDYENGVRQTDPVLNEIAVAIKSFNDDLRQRLQSMGKLEEFDENWLGRIWFKEGKGGGAPTRRPIEGSKGFLKARVFEKFQDGLDAGEVPLTYNPIEMMLLKGVEQRRYIYGQKIFSEMKDAGLVREIARKPSGALGDIPEGWTALNDKIAMSPHGVYFAPDAAATVFNNHLSPGLRSNAFYEGFRKSGAMLNAAQLGLSLFHAGFTTVDSMVSKAALGIQQIIRGNFLKGAGNVVQAFNPAQPFINAYKGDRLLRASLGQLSDPSLAPIVEALVQSGGRIGMDAFYKNETLNAFRNAISRGDKVGIAKGVLPAILDKINAPVFDQLVPRQKLGIFFDMAKDWLERNPAPTDPAAMDAYRTKQRAELGKLYDSVDNRLGQLAYDNVFWNRTLKDLLMVSVRSVGWNLGTFRELGGGIADFKNIARDKELSSRAAYVIALPFLTGLMGSMIGYMYTGNGPEELKDYFFPKTGRKRPDGTDDRMSLPSYMKDVYEYGHDISGFLKYGANPTQTLQNKMHPLISVVGQMLSNKDFFGGAIRSPGDPAVVQLEDEAKYLMNQVVPFGIRNYQQQSKVRGEEATIPGYFAQPTMVGITPSPGYVTKNDAQTQSAALGAQKDAIITKYREALQNNEITPAEAAKRMLAAGMRINEVHMVIRQGLATQKIPSKFGPRTLKPQALEAGA